MLTLDDVHAGYEGLHILQGVSLEVHQGELVALVGANGAGKTTTLRSIAGMLRPDSGQIDFEGRSLVGLAPHRIVRAGLVQVPENRETFDGLSVRKNLQMGAWTRPASEYDEALAEVHELFPVLAERSGQPAQELSGGQQQMLAIGRALMGRPRLLLLDEPSLGLAPKLVQSVFDTVQRIRERGITVLIVEQNARKTLELADRAYVLENGHIEIEGTGQDLLDDERVRSAYLGTG